MTGAELYVKKGNKVAVGKLSSDGYILEEMLEDKNFIEEGMTIESAVLKMYKKYDERYGEGCVLEMGIDAEDINQLVYTSSYSGPVTIEDIESHLTTEMYAKTEGNGTPEYMMFLSCGYSDYTALIDLDTLCITKGWDEDDR